MGSVLEIINVADLGSNQYELGVLTAGSAAISDHVVAHIESLASSGVYKVTDVPDDGHIIVSDELKPPGGPYGKPAIGRGQVYTPTEYHSFSQNVDGAVPWGETFRRDMALIDVDLQQTAEGKVDKAGDTMTGPLQLPASTDGDAPLVIPHGVTPTTPANGDLWTTADGIYVQVDGSTIGPLTEEQDLSGLVQKSGDTMTGPLTLPAGTAVEAPLRSPHGTAPDFPIDGDIWTTNAGVFAQVDGETIGPLSEAPDLSGLVQKSGDTMTGPLILPASVVGAAPLRAPQGVAPTTPANGDIWTTADGIYVRVNGVTKGPLASVAVEVPITDTGAYFTSSEVEGALQEVGEDLVGIDALLDEILGEEDPGPV